ncbi:MAG TPA: hypothetical protein VMW47_07755 [Verrucomicrobiae bacterium]|nr:hypothetical protein [Verrucomicrobiae bacterium]
MPRHRPIRTLLAVVGGCVALAIVAPPVGGVLDAVASLGLLGLVGVAAVRGIIWVDRLGRAARRAGTAGRTPAAPSRARGPVRARPDPAPDRTPAPPRRATRRPARPRPDASPDERLARWPQLGECPAPHDPGRTDARGGPARA